MNYIKPTEERQSNMRFLYDEVDAVFCDEISMVGAGKLAKINFQLQSLTEGSKGREFMGSRNFIATGDLRQLPPIQDQFITEKSKIDGRPLCAPSYWDQHFRIYYMTEKMRCRNDEEFSAICDRVGKGTINIEDEKFLQSRIISTPLEDDNAYFKDGTIAIIVTTNKKREEINIEKLERLLPHKKTYTCYSTDRTINVSKANELPSDLPYTQTGQLPSKLHIKVGAPVMITSNHKKSIYKEDGMMNGARGYIDFIQCNKDDPDDVEIIWVVFNNKETCSRYRSDFRHLRGRLNIDEYATPILPVKKRFQVKHGNIEYQRKNFSLTLGYCLTAHKCQGETYDGGVIIDFRDGFVISGSFYVAITRVKSGNKLFLKDFDSTYIKPSKDIEEKIEHMRKNKPYLFFKKYLEDKIFEFDKEDMKICYLNINKLTTCHSEYVNEDKNLLNIDILCLSDTRLTQSIKSEDIKASMPNWDIVYRHDCEDGREHMGMLFITPLNNEHSRKKLKFLKFLRAENI